MDVSTTGKLTRIEQCRINAQKRSEQKRQATLSALAALQREKRPITKAAVARQAGVSLVFLRSHPDLVQALEEAARKREAVAPPASPGSSAKDQVIAALRRRLDEMKQQLAAKDRELREKQHEIDRLYGKLAAASPLTDAELRTALASATSRLAQQAIPQTKADEGKRRSDKTEARP
jgi:predicted  nucleic acid-binding Zn-ribbon protein